ncbi:hypothetical protein GF420_09610 [candidate division GN15 bacterium]|nr:hypothetical protein [candidate division GN15 bacterium]
MKSVFIVVVGFAMLLSAATVMAGDKADGAPEDSTEVATAASPDSQQSDQVVVYYLHSNRRCMTCNKLEAYSKEAVETGFVEQLQDSSIVFRVENFETEDNEHFVEDYQIYTQSVILSRQNGGEEVEWKNLDKIWKLVGNKEDFINYVQKEVAEFVMPEDKE